MKELNMSKEIAEFLKDQQRLIDEEVEDLKKSDKMIRYAELVNKMNHVKLVDLPVEEQEEVKRLKVEFETTTTRLRHELNYVRKLSMRLSASVGLAKLIRNANANYKLNN